MRSMLRLRSFHGFVATAAFFLIAAATYGGVPEFSKEIVILPGESGGIFANGCYVRFPFLRMADQSILRPTVVKHDQRNAELTYPCGARARFAVTEDGELCLQFEQLPDTAKVIVLTVNVPLTFNNGKCVFGSFKTHNLDGRKFGYAASDTTMAVVPPKGNGLKFTGDQRLFFRMHDNRKNGGNNFQVFMEKEVTGPTAQLKVKIESFSASEFETMTSQSGRIDRFGQHVGANWPEKVTSEEDLRADIVRDKAYYASLNPPARDRFGGLPDSRNQYGFRSTGFFHVEKAGDRDVLVTPEGNLFFLVGAVAVTSCDTITYVKGRENVYQWLPEYDGEFRDAYYFDWRGKGEYFSFYKANLIRKYGKMTDQQWEVMFLERLKKWGFNAHGPWSSNLRSKNDHVSTRSSMPYLMMLPLEAKPAQILHLSFDPFAPETVAELEEQLQPFLAMRTDDPYLVGYFIRNEPRIEEISQKVPQFKGDIAAKRALVDFLRKKYVEIRAFNQAWQMNAASFDALNDLALMAKTASAREDLSNYTDLFLENYYKIVRDVYKKHDPNHLLLGCRFIPYTVSPNVARISGKYVDLFSINYYSYGIEKQYLEKIHAEAKKPFLLSEWYMGSLERGLGAWPCCVADQEERSFAYRNYVEQAATLPFIVGASWFACVDQAPTGRWFRKYDDESFNTGLVDVADRPYRTLLDQVVKTNYSIYDLITGKREAFKFHHPAYMVGDRTRFRKRLAISRTHSKITIDGNRDEWVGSPATRVTGENVTAGHSDKGNAVDFWACWDDENLYLFAVVKDPTPCKNPFDGEDVWKGDAVELFIGPGDVEKKGALLTSDRQLIAGCGSKGVQLHWFNFATRQFPCKTALVVHPDQQGYTIEMAIPFNALNIVPKADTEFLFDFGFADSEDGKKRERQFMWSGTGRNSVERDNWGIARLK